MNTQLYYSTDDQELHQMNKIRFGQQWRWYDTPIEYTFNSHHWRMSKELAEIDPNKAIITLGCSHTVGIGLPLEETWALRVAKASGLELINAARGGISPEYMLVQLKLVREGIQGRGRPRAIIANWSSIYRTVYYDEHGAPIHCLPLAIGKLQQPYKERYQNFLLDTSHIKARFTAIRKEVADIASSLGTPLIEFTQVNLGDPGIPYLSTARANILNNLDICNADYARDVQHAPAGWYGHFGLRQQQLVVDWLLPRIPRSTPLQ